MLCEPTAHDELAYENSPHGVGAFGLLACAFAPAPARHERPSDVADGAAGDTAAAGGFAGRS